jgi:hypothetical protein
MQVMDLDGNTSYWNLTGRIAKASGANKSSFHLQARELIRSIYPTMKTLEEVTIHTRKSEVAYLDFYIPLIKSCIEVHGEQHYRFTAFYHANMMAFLKAQKKDRDKKEWCLINNIRFIELPYHSINSWEGLIKNAQDS